MRGYKAPPPSCKSPINVYDKVFKVGDHVRGMWDCAVVVAVEDNKSEVKWCARPWTRATWRLNSTISPAPEHP